MTLPPWFVESEESNPFIMQRVADAVRSTAYSLQVNCAPMMAHWFMLDALLVANQANRQGMHANALAATRQCVEALSIIELGICKHAGAEQALLSWEAGRWTQGQVRAWLQANVWPQYGSGLWSEPWSVFMREFAGAVQPYSHYGPQLAQWQLRLQDVYDAGETGPMRAVMEVTPRAYDAQKATRITLYHALIHYLLGRVVIASGMDDAEFAARVNRLGSALGKSKYLDGKSTKWGQQFWAMMWKRGGGTILE